jgi:ABC-type Zn2+ transport system substrate-binding protein/surface adhesin
MGMTLWIHTLDGRGLSTDSDDHSLMYAYADELDALCTELGVEKLSSFFDTTDLDYQLSQEGEDEDEPGAEDAEDEDEDEAEDEDDDEEEIDPETGAPYGVDDMRWFDPAVGLATMVALRDAIEDDETAVELAAGDHEDLLAELDDCIQALEETTADAGKFHLAVVM